MKRLVLCCDGTWNRADQHQAQKSDTPRPTPTNVVKLAYRVAKRDGETPQLIFYDHGVGTGNVLDRILGGLFGHGLDENIFDAYRFLIANYELGDEIYLFGFSRGAYTARSIAGMIRKCGILDRGSVGQYMRAMSLYREDGVRADDEPAVKFRREHSISPEETIPIRFVGVWDTVGSLGIPLRGLRWLSHRKYTFHDTELSKAVKFACQALAIDEHRAPFAPTLWAYAPKEDQHVEQVWFSGAHSDVGGGYNEFGLSDIALEWMIDRAATAGLVFGGALFRSNPLKPDPRGVLHVSKKGFYRLTKGINRPIALVPAAPGSKQQSVRDPRQVVHPSALQRWDGDPTYRPKNLRDYFALLGDSRARE